MRVRPARTSRGMINLIIEPDNLAERLLLAVINEQKGPIRPSPSYLVGVDGLESLALHWMVEPVEINK